MMVLLYFIVFFPGIQNLLDQHTLLEKLIEPQKEDKLKNYGRTITFLKTNTNNFLLPKADTITDNRPGNHKDEPVKVSQFSSWECNSTLNSL